MSGFAASVGRITGAVAGTDRAGGRERRKKREEPASKGETATRDEVELEGEPAADATPGEEAPQPPPDVRGVYGRGGEARGRGTGSLDIRA